MRYVGIPGTKLVLSKGTLCPTFQLKVGSKIFSVQEPVTAINYKPLPYHLKHLPVFLWHKPQTSGSLTCCLLPLTSQMFSHPPFSFILGVWDKRDKWFSQGMEKLTVEGGIGNNKESVSSLSSSENNYIRYELWITYFLYEMAMPTWSFMK